MPFTSVFGGDLIYPSQTSYLAIALTENFTLQWPTEVAAPGELVAADIMDVTPDAAGRALMMPSATNASPGTSVLFTNLAADTFSVLDFDGDVIVTVASGESWTIYLTDNTDDAGTWHVFQMGAGTSTAVAAALAGAGLKAITTTLNVKILPRSSAVSPLAIINSDRARVVSWTGGVGAGTLLDPAVVGSDWFVYVRNNGTGTWTITPAAGTINGATTLALSPFGSAIVYTDGVNYYTIGLSSITPSNFDFTAINVAGTGNYVLAGTELNRIAYRLTGVITGARNIIVPTTVQQYWINNSTTGAFALTVKTLLGAGIVVPAGCSMIVYCDGTDVIAGEGVPTTGLLPPLAGGTGLNAYAQGDVLYASAANVLSALPKSATATRYLANTGGSNAPNWDLVNLANGVTGDLPYANLAQGSALSVLGVTVNAVADLASIVGTAGQVLRVNNAGNALAFGTVDLSLAAAVTGILDETNGGTGLSTYAQGDLIYASAANTLARLAKATTVYKTLTNTGGGANNPEWTNPRYSGNGQLSADYQVILNDAWWTFRHTSASPHNVTLPLNATVPFEVGTCMWFANPTTSGALSITAAGTLTGHGQTVTGNLIIPAGYNAVVIYLGSDIWMIITDAPSIVATDITYTGYVGADGTTGNRFSHAGWSAARTGTGAYTVTHNLGLADGTRLSVGMAVYASAGNRTGYLTTTSTGNAFDLGITDAGAGTASDQAFMFVAKRN